MKFHYKHISDYSACWMLFPVFHIINAIIHVVGSVVYFRFVLSFILEILKTMGNYKCY